MGGLCSKQTPTPNPYSGRSVDKEKQYQQRHQVQRDTSNTVMTPTTVQESMEKPVIAKESPRLSPRYANVSDDEFYDGIPRYQKSLYQKSRSSRKVSEVSSRLGRAGSAGLGRAVEVLDTLGSTVTNLNLKGGFASGATNKNNELSILGFEVANTIVKGSNLMQSLSKRSIRQLKEVVLPTEGVQELISNDMDELLRIVASDNREELKVFAGEVIRFGNRCKDPQWHNLDRFFEKRGRTPQKQLREIAESVMLQLMTSVQLTAELYQELHALDRFEQDYQRKRLEEFRFNAAQRGDRDNSLNILAGELKSQRKLVKNLKKKSLWSRSMEEVMEKLVDIVLFLNQEINYTFDNPEGETPEEEIISNQQKLGPAGLSLHYANIILQIDSIMVEGLIRHVSDDSPNVRRLCLRGLVQMPQVHVVQYTTQILSVIVALLDDPDESVQLTAVSCLLTVLGSSSTDAVEPILLNLSVRLRNLQICMNPKIRANAFAAFGAISNYGFGPQRDAFLEQVHAAFPRLVLHLHDDDLGVRRACRNTFKRIAPLVEFDGMVALANTHRFSSDHRGDYEDFLRDIAKQFTQHMSSRVDTYMASIIQAFEAPWPVIQANAIYLCSSVIAFSSDQHISALYQSQVFGMLIAKINRSSDAIVRATGSLALGLLLKSTNSSSWKFARLDPIDSILMGRETESSRRS